ncbi:conserved Plasmodium protein, unknown function [Plasmodium malariae]|uniref:Uncharacterized protein n=1 Tax=Plasmodium malariae TaxID=5858 RepID=A0A1C3KC44_PLAMA|nr:conserved Plasmodium protein, unknown function [Plasmodium malariae]
MNAFHLPNFYVVIYFILILNNLFYTKKVKRFTSSNNTLGHYYDIKKNEDKKKSLHFILNNGMLIKSTRKGRVKRSILYVENIKDIYMLVGGHVKVKTGSFKDCCGVILDLKKTVKDEYEILVVINRDESYKYPKSILNKFGKSYWFNIKDIEIKKLKHSFFHNYDNFYDKKKNNLTDDVQSVQDIKTCFKELDEQLLSGDKDNLDDLSSEAGDLFDENELLDKNSVDGQFVRRIRKKLTENFGDKLGQNVGTKLMENFGEMLSENFDGEMTAKYDDIVETQYDINAEGTDVSEEGTYNSAVQLYENTEEEKVDGDKQEGEKQEGEKQEGEKQEGEKQEGEKQEGVKQEEGEKQEGAKQEEGAKRERNDQMDLFDPLSEIVRLREDYIKGDKKRKNTHSSFCHTVVKEIEKNYVYTDLLNLYKNKRHLSNIVVCFYILKQLVRIYNFEKDNEKLKNNFLKNVIHNNNFENIINDIKNFLERKEIYRVVDKTWLLWTLVKLNIHKEEKYKEQFKSILKYILKYINYGILKKLNTKSLCAILWSLAKCSYNNLKVYKKLLYFLEKYIITLTCQDISNIYYSLSLINYNDQSFFELIEQEINKKINKFSVQSLMNILWGMAKQKRRNNTFNIVKDKLLFYSTSLDIRNISLFLWCLNKNNYYSVDINFEGKKFQDLNIKQAMQLLLFFNYNKKKYLEYLKYVLHFLFQNISALTNQEISFFSYSLSKLNLLNKSFSKMKTHILKRDYNTFNLIDVNMLLLSLNNSNIYDKTVINFLFLALKNILNDGIITTINEQQSNSEILLTGQEKKFTNFNFIMKNLAEMKIFDQDILLYYILYYSHNFANITIDELADYMYYTTSINNPYEGERYEQSKSGKEDAEKVGISECQENNNIQLAISSDKMKQLLISAGGDELKQLLIKSDKLKLDERDFQKVYLHYLNKIILFLREKMINFDAHSFLEHLNRRDDENKNDMAGKSKNKIETFVFNYQSDDSEKDVKKLNELFLGNDPNTVNVSSLENLTSDQEYSDFVNEKKNDQQEKIENEKKHTPLCTSINSLLHLFHSFSFINAFDKRKIDSYFDNLYHVVNEKKSEITAYQWLLIKDIIKMVKIKNKKDWEILLDNVNTYVSNTEDDQRDYFETINIDI